MKKEYDFSQSNKNPHADIVSSNNKFWLDYFLKQKDIFVDEISQSMPPINFFCNPKSLKIENPNNWVIMFRPKSWGKLVGGFTGVYYSFRLEFHKHEEDHRIRVYLNLNKPLKRSYIEDFKKQAIERIRPLDLDKNTFSFYPDIKAKPWEYSVPANDLAGINAAQYYAKLTAANDVVASMIREFYKAGAFSKEIIFDHK